MYTEFLKLVYNKKGVINLKQRQIYEVDENGFIVEVYLGVFSDEGILIEPVGSFITSDLPQPLHYYKPKWDGAKWIEGETEEEKAAREAEEQLVSLMPSAEEITNAELEIKMLTLLTELEVI